MLSREEVLKIARLARLELSDEEVTHYQKRLARVLDYMRELSAVETPKDAFVRHVPKDAVSVREDMPVPFQNPQSLLENSPETDAGSFLLPAILEH